MRVCSPYAALPYTMHKLPKQFRRYLTIGGLLGWGVLAGCTPPVSIANLEWTAANNTATELQITVQYALDSTLMTTPEQFAFVRQNQVQDSLASKGFPVDPLRWLSQHQQRWYFVYDLISDIQAHQYTPAGAISGYAQVDRAHGRLTYTLPPHSTQTLVVTGYDGSLAGYESMMTGLWLQQGATHQQVLPGHPIADVFRAECTGREHGNNS